MNMFLRNSKIFKSKVDRTSIYGTIDKNNPKAFFFEFKLDVTPIEIGGDINNIINRIQKNINLKINKEIESKYSNLFFKEYVITIIDLKNSSLNSFKKSKADIEITIKAKDNILKTHNIENLLNDVSMNFKRVIKNNLLHFKTV